MISNKKFQVQNLTKTDIPIPWGVEIVWAVITPLNVTSESTIQKIVVGCLYCKPGSKKENCTVGSHCRSSPYVKQQIQEGSSLDTSWGL